MRRLARLAVLVPFAALLHSPSPAWAQVSLGAAEDVAVLAGSAVTCTDSMVTANVAIYPGTAVTQTNCTIPGGTVHAGDPVAQQAYDDFLLAYADIAARPCGTLLTVLSGQTLLPGVYCVSAAVTETGGVLTLDGSSRDTWIFKIGTSGTGALTGTNFSVVMTSGETRNTNVFWWTAEAATLTDSVFLGSILAGTSITVTRESLGGQALAKAAVTLTGTGVFVETIVTAAGAGVFPAGAAYLGLPLSSLSLGMGVGVAGNWATGQLQVTLTGTNILGLEQNIVVEGQVTGSIPSAFGTAKFSGTSTVDPGDGTPPLPGVPFAALVVANPDGTGSLTLNLGGTILPAAAISEGT